MRRSVTQERKDGVKRPDNGLEVRANKNSVSPLVVAFGNPHISPSCVFVFEGG